MNLHPSSDLVPIKHIVTKNKEVKLEGAARLYGIERGFCLNGGPGGFRRDVEIQSKTIQELVANPCIELNSEVDIGSGSWLSEERTGDGAAYRVGDA
ncbi:MAG: hypothetical protein V9G12_04375 [Microthrixaceae bacterium]